MRTAVFATALLTSLIIWTLPAGAREAGVAEGVVRQELFTEPMAGEPGKEVVTDVYSIPAGAVLPWHIHPDAHEVSYILSGALTLEIEGEGSKHLKAGESFYLHPNAVHRGLNEGTVPVKLFVVRVKPTDEPLAVDLDPGKAD
ncbi:MAG TPA: cupin domain-containing protein [Methyloceanibacter sp.]|nr:cupin domain-containing protein [Methyloceanibacter sp.]